MINYFNKNILIFIILGFLGQPGIADPSTNLEAPITPSPLGNIWLDWLNLPLEHYKAPLSTRYKVMRDLWRKHNEGGTARQKVRKAVVTGAALAGAVYLGKTLVDNAETFEAFNKDHSDIAAGVSIAAALSVAVTADKITNWLGEFAVGGAKSVIQLPKNIRKSFSGEDPYDLLKNTSHDIDNQQRHLMILYKAQEPYITPGLRYFVDRSLYSLTTNTMEVPAFSAALTAVLSLPSDKFKPLTYDNKATQGKLTGYLEPTTSLLKSYAYEIAKTSEAKSRSRVRYFLGEPGTGKTHAAKLLGDLLKTPVSIVSLSGQTVNDLIGTATKPGALVQAMTKHQNKVGMLSDLQFSNTIIVFDDFDRILNDPSREAQELNGFMLKLLDPAGNFSFESPYFGTTLTLPQNIVLTGNQQLPDEALRKRFGTITFTGFTADYKRRIIWARFVPQVLKKFNFKGKLDADVIMAIKHMIARDKDVGLRSLHNQVENFISEYLRDLNMGELNLEALIARYTK